MCCIVVGKTITLGFNDFRQVLLALEHSLEGFYNQHLATETMKSETIRLRLRLRLLGGYGIFQ